jgi:hypothetical protein
MLTFFGITLVLACYNEAAARSPMITAHLMPLSAKTRAKGMRVFHARKPSAGSSRRPSALGKKPR